MHPGQPRQPDVVVAEPDLDEHHGGRAPDDQQQRCVVITSAVRDPPPGLRHGAAMIVVKLTAG